MIVLENIETGQYYEGEDLELFIDDDTLIGEVYLDGELIFQALDVIDEDQLEFAFNKSFTQIDQDILMY